MPVIAVEGRVSGNLWGCLSYVMRLFLEHDYETVRLFLDHDYICDYENLPFIIFVKTTKFSHI